MNTKPSKRGILVSEEKIESAQQSLSSFFRERGKELQERLHVGETPLYPQEEVAKNLNISVAQLRNKIYRKKPLTRDWLIAICAAYGLDWQETSDALRICNMPGLDDNEASTREKFIINFLDEHSYQPVSVFVFNRELEAAKLPPLEISFRNGKGKIATTKLISPMYRETRPRVIRTYANEGDRYNSLSTQYLPNMRCVAAAFLEDLDQKKYLLEANSDGTYTVTDEKAAFPTTIEQLEPDHEFRVFFTELSILVQNRKQKLDDVLNDTKNYQNRFSANIKNDCLHIFYEEFNYSMPERNEYYLMEYVDGHYQLSIAYRSMFMQEYLTPDQYYLHYHTHKAIPRKTYASLEEIDKTFDEKGRSYFYPDLQKYIKRAFCRMKKIVEEKLQDLQQEKIFIQNFDYIFDDPTEVLKWYKAEELFHCTYDSEFGAIDSFDESIQYTDANGESTEITFDDIILAFKLGINSISEISRIKIQKGSISSLLV